MLGLLNDPQDMFTLKAASNCQRALMSVVTSARGVGARVGINILIAQQTASGEVVGPRIIAAGECLQFPGWCPCGLIRLTETPEDLLIAIQEQINQGARLIKVGVTGPTADGQQFPNIGPDG